MKAPANPKPKPQKAEQVFGTSDQQKSWLTQDWCWANDGRSQCWEYGGDRLGLCERHARELLRG